MRLRQVAALAFVDEMDKIATELNLPLNFVPVDDVAFLLSESVLGGMLGKEAATRAVKEWQRANAGGDSTTADAIAKGYGQAGLKPRQLRDISIGGAEAGVDQMMGSAAHVAPGGLPQADAVAPRRALDGRLDQMKANKAQLGLEGRAPTSSVRQSPTGRAALLRGTQSEAPAASAPNESGYIARKMYKPDSFISQAEFTPQHVQQKMEMTQAARALGPEAKEMVPDMYGHKSMGAGPTQRTMSYHEFVPGMQDLRGRNTGTDGRELWSNRDGAAKDIGNVKDKVLDPLKAKGMVMGDVTGERGTNWGNIARGADGKTKIVDFLPTMKGKQMPAMQSFAKYAPMPTLRHSEEGGGTVKDLRKEMFKPTMESRPATPEQVNMALSAHGQAQGTAPPAVQKPSYSAAPDPFKAPAAALTPSPVSGIAPTKLAPKPVATMATAPTTLQPPTPMAAAGTAAATPRARAALAPVAQTPTQAAPTAAPGIKPVGAAPVGAAARVPPHPLPHPTAVGRSMLPTRPVLGGLHR